MTINKKIILRIFGVIALIFIILFIFLWFYYKNIETKDVGNVNINAPNGTRGPGGLPTGDINGSGFSPEIDIPTVREPVTPSYEASIINVAILISERMGSYSTDTFNFSNLRDVKHLMTNKMNGWVDDLIKNSLTIPATEDYYGVTTKALSVDIVNPEKLEEGIAEAVISCQKIETRGKEKPVTKIKYQNLKMRLLKIDDKWLVDEVEWQ